MNKSSTKLHILLSLFIGILVGMNLLGGKVTTLFGISISVAIFMTPLSFLITDIVEEVYGKRVVKNFLLSGILVLAIIFLYTVFFIKLPANERFKFDSEYETIFGNSIRMIIASLFAFALGQLHDMWSFAFWKKKTKGKHLWLRNNFSTIISQAIDTFVFLMIAFYQLTPKFDFIFILKMFYPYYLFKAAFAILDTPFVYLGKKWLKKK